MGLGLAATRDVVSFLRYDVSAANPLGGNIHTALAFGQSQSGRYLKDSSVWASTRTRLVASCLRG